MEMVTFLAGKYSSADRIDEFDECVEGHLGVSEVWLVIGGRGRRENLKSFVRRGRLVMRFMMDIRLVVDWVRMLVGR